MKYTYPITNRSITNLKFNLNSNSNKGQTHEILTVKMKLMLKLVALNPQIKPIICSWWWCMRLMLLMMKLVFLDLTQQPAVPSRVQHPQQQCNNTLLVLWFWEIYWLLDSQNQNQHQFFSFYDSSINRSSVVGVKSVTMMIFFLD